MKVKPMNNPMYTDVREFDNSWIAYDTWIKIDQKFYKSVTLSQLSLNPLEGYLLSWYEDFGTQYLLTH